MQIKTKPSKIGRTFIGRLKLNDNLLETLNRIAVDKKIKAGFISVIGALQNVNLGFYNQKLKKYTECLRVKSKLEISSCTGNISVKDYKAFVHTHIVCSDHSGKTIGGHLMNKSKVFAAEYVIFEIKNVKLIRTKDSDTGLPLWKFT